MDNKIGGVTKYDWGYSTLVDQKQPYMHHG